MTKHLRLFMLMLLALVCMGGYSAVGDTYKLVTSVDELKAGDVIVVANTSANKAMGVAGTSGNNFTAADVTIADNVLSWAENVNEITLESSSDKWLFKTSAGYLYAPGTKDKNYLRITDKSATVGTNAAITIASNGDATIAFSINNATYANTLKYNTQGSGLFSCYKSSSGQPLVQIYKKQKADDRKNAGIKFEKDSYIADINKGEFSDAKLSNPNNLTVTYSISPENEDITIDENTGEVIYTLKEEATCTVTATFAGNDTYKPATASYTLTIGDPNYETKVVTFDATVDKGETTGTEADEMSKNQVTISSTSAALGNGTNYRFYGSGTTHTFTTSIGNITKIEFQGNATGNPLTNIKLKDEVSNGTFTSAQLKATWTGEAKEVAFTTTAQARATKIIVTIKAPVAKDYGTLDEDAADNSDKVQTAWDNVNITLKRTLYADGGWNTLCLPFSLTAEQAEEAFGTVTLRQIDADKSTGNTITFKEATTIEAGVPYLIKVNKVAEDNTYNFTGVKVTGDLWSNVKAGNAEFVGNFDNTLVSDLTSAGIVACLGADNKLFRAETSADSYFKGFRAYFLLPEAAQAEAIKVVIDGTATGIGDLQIDGARANGRVYNLAGQCVGTSLDSLKAGVYIQNGKKVIKK